MEIRQVAFRKLVSGHNYDHVAVEASAVVQDGEKPEDALAALRGWVSDQVADAAAIPKQVEDRRQELWRAEDELRHTVDGLRKAKGQFEEAQKILAAHGIEIPEIEKRVWDDMPF